MREILTLGMWGLIAIAALATLGWGLYVIGEVSLMSWRRRSTRSFFSDIWDFMQGLWIVIIPLMLLSVPVFLVLSVIVALAGQPSVLQSVKPLLADERYKTAVKMAVEDADKPGASSDTVLERATEYLVEQGIPRETAKQNLQQVLAVYVAAAKS